MRRRNFLAGSGFVLGNALVPGNLASAEPSKRLFEAAGKSLSVEMTATDEPSSTAVGQTTTTGSITALHAEVEALATDKPALVLSMAAIESIVLNNFNRINLPIGNNGPSILTQLRSPVDGIADVSVKLSKLSIDQKNPLKVALVEQVGNIFADISPSFTTDLSVFWLKDPSQEFSTIRLEVRSMQVELQGMAPFLLLKQPVFDVAGHITRSSSRSNALKASGISEEDIDAVEGALAFVTPHTLVRTVFSVVDSIDLSKMFPSVELRGNLQLHRVNDGLVIITTEDIAIRPPDKCSPNCTSIPTVSSTSGQTVKDNDKDVAEYSWKLSTGPLPTLQSSPLSLRDGFAAIYLPKPVFEQRFSQVLPAIEYRDSDNGFLGWELLFTAGIAYLTLKLDPSRFGIIVDYEIKLDGFVSVNVDVPCIGRMDLATARTSVDRARMSVFLGLSVSKDDKLALIAGVDSLSIVTVHATVNAFSRWLTFAGGWGVVAGFILDYILRRVIEHNIPIKLREKMTEAVNAGNIPLLDLESLGRFARYRGGFDQGSFSGSASSMLVGLYSVG